MWSFKKKEKLTFIPAQNIEQVYFNGYSKGLMKSKEAFTELGAHEERERIIKLLEERLYPIYYPKSKLTGSGEGELIGDIIALIKGENK